MPFFFFSSFLFLLIKEPSFDQVLHLMFPVAFCTVLIVRVQTHESRKPRFLQLQRSALKILCFVYQSWLWKLHWNWKEMTECELAQWAMLHREGLLTERVELKVLTRTCSLYMSLVHSLSLSQILCLSLLLILSLSTFPSPPAAVYFSPPCKVFEAISGFFLGRFELACRSFFFCSCESEGCK